MAPARVPFIGLTGGIAAGKSTALKALAGLGAAVLSTDAVVHELYASPEVRDLVVARWGEQVAPGGVVDRAAVASHAFAAPEERAWLEGVLWPRVGARVASWRERVEAQEPPPPAGVVETPLLFEAGLEAAYDATIAARYPLLAKAILAGASPQIRNVASIGGNLLQRTRCVYFYDAGTRCNKREPGTGCPALEGVNRMHAILGASEHCIAVHPSDMCVALAALDATVHLSGPGGARVVPFAEFHRLPGDTPHIDTNLRDDELITAVELPKQGFAEHHAYVKVRDRASYAFALVSVALGLELDGDVIVNAHCALGGVAHKPWRDADAEASLRGKALNARTVRDFASKVLCDARGRRGNAFKIELAARAIERAFAIATQRSFEESAS